MAQGPFLARICPRGLRESRRQPRLFLLPGTPHGRAATRRRPRPFLRWLSQQTRWSKSYFREWLLLMRSGGTGTTRGYSLRGGGLGALPLSSWRPRCCGSSTRAAPGLLWVLLCVQGVALAKAAFAAWLRGCLRMLLLSLYAPLYMGGLLPAKFLALATMNQTAGARRAAASWPPTTFARAAPGLWALLLLGGLVRQRGPRGGPTGAAPPGRPRPAISGRARAPACCGLLGRDADPLLGGRAKALPTAGGEAATSRCEAGCTGRWLGGGPRGLSGVPGRRTC